MRYKTFELLCRGEKLLMRQQKGESIKETLLREFGWLLKPIIEQTKSFEKSLDKLNWKIEKKYK
jgi:hypothetical protein